MEIRRLGTRIDASVLKILRMKASAGLDRKRFVDLSNVDKEIARPENLAIAQKIADSAITLVSDPNKLVPLQLQGTSTPQASKDAAANQPAWKAGSNIVAVVFGDGARSSEGARTFARELHQRAPTATVFYVDESNAGFIERDVMAAIASAKAVINLAEAVPSARRTTAGQAGGSVDLDQSAAQLLADIVKNAGPKTVTVAFGNPYIGAQIPGIGTYLCTFSNTPGSATSLIKALFGELPIHGRLPVSVPGIAQRGVGLDR